MKTKYTRKQITEAIKHWKKVLESMEVVKEAGPYPKKKEYKRLIRAKHDFDDDKTYTIDLDVVTEKYDKGGNKIGYMTNEEIDQYMNEIAKKYHLTASITAYQGSGGGWPDVAFTGAKKDLREMYQQWYCGGNVNGEFCETFDDYFKEHSTQA